MPDVPLIKFAHKGSWSPVHSRVAAAGLVTGALLAVATPWSDLGLGILFLACAFGLLGEARHIHNTGEFTARDWALATRFIAVKRVESPYRFRSYVFAFAVFGVFCLVVGALFIWLTVSKYAA